MTPAGILFRATLSGALIGLMLWLSNAHWPFYSGILFFPAISVPVFYFIGRDFGMVKMRETIVGGLAALPAWVIFAGALYWASYRFRLLPALGPALGV
jgi:uncharacterized membrane protein (GlpM family)